MTIVARAMTTREMLAMPGEGIERELIDGRLREIPATARDRWHGASAAQLGYVLVQWLVQQSEPRGKVLCDAGFRLRRDPDTSVGIDVAYVSAEVVRNTSESFPYLDGAPVLAAEIIALTDRRQGIAEKVRIYLDAGV